ncbi:hypothetical protein H012_gp891 [Acanthamoeba polyphaga moumouvirus]|uniref:Uncharacterized protein n=2 Tax=Moumouvirus TaxID=3080801 RepID=L7RFK8_9VIRU|nr:hypothetical protein H012_gp891 [Acanthamoeba polyphaga moumouvirus]AEX63300.1 hypothetical protein mv_R1098 [Moumouvirus Monve]AGC01575.1 hypothetical protein Moumou_00027 [Acanthamoeba polyphaga moumouvirus]
MQFFGDKINELRSDINDNIRFTSGVHVTRLSTRAYKRVSCVNKDKLSEKKKAIAILTIPPGSIVVKPFGGVDQVRTDRVYVEKIEDMDGNTLNNHICESPAYYNGVFYKKGSIVMPRRGDPLDVDPSKIHVSGIHLFFHKKSARDRFIGS